MPTALPSESSDMAYHVAPSYPILRPIPIPIPIPISYSHYVNVAPSEPVALIPYQPSPLGFPIVSMYQLPNRFTFLGSSM